MSDTIKLGNLDISSFKVGSGDCTIYLGDTLLYPTTPSFQGKWLATYTGGTTSSADCDASSAITNNEITKTYLETVEIGDCVTSIGNNTFQSCTGLTSCTIGSGVTTIGNSVFQNCYGLSSVTIPDGVTSLGSSVFNNCSGLTSVSIGSGVTSIGNSVFSGCRSLTSIEMPNSVTSIGNSVFNYCRSLTSVTIPNSVTSIGSAVFVGCYSLSSVTIPDSVTSLGVQAFAYNSGLTSCAIGSGVTSINQETFSNCTSLASVSIGSGVTSIASSAFTNCISLTSITIPNSVTSIDSWAFRDCYSLSSITIPDSVTSLGSSAFINCSGLTAITVNATTPPTLGTYVFYNTNCPIYVPSGSVSAYQSAWSDYASRIQAIPSRLPQGYTEVEYIENTGTSYINTNFKPNQDTRIVATMQTVTSTQFGRLFGCGSYDKTNAIQFDYENGAQGTLHISWGTTAGWTIYSSCVGDYNKHTYEWNGNVFYRDKGEPNQFSATTAYGAYQCTDNLGIFTRYQNGSGGGSSECFRGKVFDFKMYDNGTLIRDLVPCIRDNDNTVGAYDIVNDVFYYPPNYASYPLIAGNPI